MTTQTKKVIFEYSVDNGKTYHKLEKISEIPELTCEENISRLGDAINLLGETIRLTIPWFEHALLEITNQQKYLGLHGKRRVAKKWLNKFQKLVRKELKQKGFKTV